MKALIIILLFFLSFGVVDAQNKPQLIIVKAIVVEGDTIPYFNMPEVRIISQRIFKSEKEQRKYSKLVRDIKKVYPYAKLAGVKINEYNIQISAISNKKEKKRMLDNAEEQLKKQFGGEIRKMTFSQGRLLIKLIDRETGNTSFEVIKQLRGGLQAFLWQSIALIFGNDLKSEYDAEGDDKMIEEIVVKIENGIL